MSSHIIRRKESLALYKSFNGTPTKRQVLKRQVSKRQVSKRPVSKRPVLKRPKRQVHKTSGLQIATTRLDLIHYAARSHPQLG